jgi:hypothetical protein
MNKHQFTVSIHQQLSGAAEARRAHNPEGNGSKPFSAIIFVFLAVFHFLLLFSTTLLHQETKIQFVTLNLESSVPTYLLTLLSHALSIPINMHIFSRALDSVDTLTYCNFNLRLTAATEILLL